MRIPDGRQAGFTLLEALIALTILAGATAALMMLIATNRRAQAEAHADISAAIEARTILARIGRDLPLKVGTLSGVFGDGGSWSVQVTPFTPADGYMTATNPALLQVQVRLMPAMRKTISIEVVSLKRMPR